MLELITKRVLVVDSDETGRKAREIRKQKNLPLAVVATSMSITVSYLSNLESGHRRWSEVMVLRFNKAIEACSPSS